MKNLDKEFDEELENLLFDLEQNRRRSFSTGKLVKSLVNKHYLPRKEVEEIIKGEKVEEGEAMYKDDPDGKMSAGFTDGYNKALEDLLQALKKQ